MARALTAARATVPRERESEYLGTLRRLAERMRRRGEHLWVFRHPAAPGEFLEFSEAASPERHRARALRDDAEMALERALANIAAYSPEAQVLWEEVSLEDR